jgi:hypothetical protein
MTENRPMPGVNAPALAFFVFGDILPCSTTVPGLTPRAIFVILIIYKVYLTKNIMEMYMWQTNVIVNHATLAVSFNIM